MGLHQRVCKLYYLAILERQLNRQQKLSLNVHYYISLFTARHAAELTDTNRKKRQQIRPM